MRRKQILEKRESDAIYLNVFITHYLEEKQHLSKEMAFSNLVDSFLNNEFEFHKIEMRAETDFIFESVPSGKILLETNTVIKVIKHYPEFQAMSDAVFTPEFRFKGIELLFQKISRTKLMRYCKYIGANTHEIVLLFNIARKYFIGVDYVQYWTVINDLPVSSALKILSKIRQNEFCMQDILLKPDGANMNSNIRLEPYFFELLEL
jgi:hypothetical protein